MRPNAGTPLTLNWNRARVPETNPAGEFAYRIVYFCQVNASTVLNVWREGYWKWIAIGFSEDGMFLGAHGDGLTKRECQIKAEHAVHEHGIKPMQEALGFVADEPDGDLPF